MFQKFHFSRLFTLFFLFSLFLGVNKKLHAQDVGERARALFIELTKLVDNEEKEGAKILEIGSPALYIEKFDLMMQALRADFPNAYPISWEKRLQDALILYLAGRPNANGEEGWTFETEQNYSMNAEIFLAGLLSKYPFFDESLKFKILRKLDAKFYKDQKKHQGFAKNQKIIEADGIGKLEDLISAVPETAVFAEDPDEVEENAADAAVAGGEVAAAAVGPANFAGQAQGAAEAEDLEEEKNPEAAWAQKQENMIVANEAAPNMPVVGPPGMQDNQAVNAAEEKAPGKKNGPLKVFGDGALRKLINDQFEAFFDEGKRPPISVEDVLAFYSGLEDIYYDRAVGRLEAGEDFIQYFGREEEKMRIVDVLQKMTKAHQLLTGKAGVGKTTLMKMVQDAFVLGELKVFEEEPPIFIELPVTDVTNPNDPTALKKRIALADKISQFIKRRIVLFVDEAHVITDLNRNAIKGMLANAIDHLDPETGLVHLMFATTSKEGRTFLDDDAFARRWTENFVDEFSDEDTIKLIEQTWIPRWKKHYIKNGNTFAGVSDNEVYDYAIKLGSFEQPHAGKPAAPMELLEATITYKINRLDKDGGEFTISNEDIRQYLKDKKQIRLMPGDPDFSKIFEEIWTDEVESRYVGQHALLNELKKLLKAQFLNLKPPQVLAVPVFGAPAAGKSYLTEVVGDAFFGGHVLTINGPAYKGRQGINKLIGSGTGYVGSEEDRSPLTEKLQENPRLLLVIEEADFGDAHLYEFLTDLITSKKFQDGLGREWDASQMVIMLNSNMGQELMIPARNTHNMTWGDYGKRRKRLLQEDPKHPAQASFDRKKVEGIFKEFMAKVFSKGDADRADQDSNDTDRDVTKHLRRYHPLYALPPNLEELKAAAKLHWKNFEESSKKEYKVTFSMHEETLLQLMDFDNYDFAKGFSHVEQKLEYGLFMHLRELLGTPGKSYAISISEEENEGKIKRYLLVKTDDADIIRENLTELFSAQVNPWIDDPEMIRKIEKLPELMAPYLIGNDEVKNHLQDALREKLLNWNQPLVVTLLGPTGNGKTELGHALGKALFDDGGRASFVIPGLHDEFELNNYLRPPTGIQGGREATEFERWILERSTVGGGVIILDEFLSFHGMNRVQISNKLRVIEKFYDHLDKGWLRIGGKTIDTRPFTTVITGNALQEFFAHLPDDPSADALAERILESIDERKVVEYFESIGVDAPKLARLGRKTVLRPLNENEAFQVAEKEVQAFLKNMKADNPALDEYEVVVSDELLGAIVALKKTHLLGMRNVKNEGLRPAIFQPLAKIIGRLQKEGVKKKKIEFVYVKKDGHLRVKIGGRFEDDYKAVLKDVVTKEKKVILSQDFIEEVATHEYRGHWAVGLLLERENTFSDISIIPGPGYLGYVRSKDQSEKALRVNSLISMFKEALVLNAGYRSVQKLKGLRAPGGGGNGLASPVEGNSDFAKIRRILAAMFENKMLHSFSRDTPPQVKSLIKKWFYELLDQMVEEIIDTALNIDSLDEGYKKLVKDKYLGEEELDQLARGVDFNAELREDWRFMLTTLQSSFEKIMKAEEQKMGADVLKALGLESKNGEQEKHLKRVFFAQLFEMISTEYDSFLTKAANQKGHFDKDIGKLKTEALKSLELGDSKLSMEQIAQVDLSTLMSSSPVVCERVFEEDDKPEAKANAED